MDSMHVSDSTLDASFLEKSGMKIDKDIIVTTGLIISNSELGDGAAKFNAVYKVENTDGKKVTVIRDELATINHGNNPDTIKEKLKKLENLEQNRKDTILAVKEIKWSKKIKRDDVLKLMALISHVRNVPLEMRGPEGAKNNNYHTPITAFFKNHLKKTGDYIQVYRIKSHPNYSSDAAKYAYNHMYISNKINYLTTTNLYLKNPSYCSKYVYLAYWWGTSHKGMKGGLMWVFPFSMTNVFFRDLQAKLYL